MIEITLKEIANITNGKVVGDPLKKIKGVQIDTRDIQKGMLFVPIIGERVNGHSFVEKLFNDGIAAASFWQEGQENMPNGDLVVVKDVITALQQLAKYYRSTLKTKFVGITGSVGKTSSKDLACSVLKTKYKVQKTFQNKNNIIGVPLTILNLDNDNDYAVIEMCVTDFNQMEIEADIVRPHYTIITNIAPCHIEYLKSLDNIVIEKCKINTYLDDGQCFYFNEAYGLNKYLNNMGLKNKPISFGFDNDADTIGFNYQMGANGMVFKCNKSDKTFSIPLLGNHMVANALGTIALAKYIGLTDQQIQEGFDNVDISPHRLQIKHINKATVIDDTYNCNPSSLKASLNTILEYGNNYKVYACLADMLELGDDEIKIHCDTIKDIDYSKFEQVILTGNLMSHLYDTLVENGVNAVYYSDREQLKQYVKTILENECVIIFKASGGMNFSKLVEDLEA